MTATYYMSITSDSGTMGDVDNAGTSSTSTDVIELRIGNGTYAPTRSEALLSLAKFRRWIMEGGLDGLGANIPLPTGNR